MKNKNFPLILCEGRIKPDTICLVKKSEKPIEFFQGFLKPEDCLTYVQIPRDYLVTQRKDVIAAYLERFITQIRPFIIKKRKYQVIFGQIFFTPQKLVTKRESKKFGIKAVFDTNCVSRYTPNPEAKKLLKLCS